VEREIARPVRARPLGEGEGGGLSQRDRNSSTVDAIRFAAVVPRSGSSLR